MKNISSLLVLLAFSTETTSSQKYPPPLPNPAGTALGYAATKASSLRGTAPFYGEKRTITYC
jgi:hypothetical protein